jgi:probable phosphoglycerate mutase
MAVLLLIRHGQNDMVGKRLAGRLPEVHLNAEGRAQARRLAAELAGADLKAVYASPLERARETAEPLARVHNLAVETCPDLIEIDFGRWQGKRLKQLKRRKLWQVVQETPDQMQFPDGESFAGAQSRVAAGLRAIADRHGEKDLVACVAHSDVIRLAVAHFLGLPLNHFQRIQISPASVTVLFLNQDHAFFGAINQTTSFQIH